MVSLDAGVSSGSSGRVKVHKKMVIIVTGTRGSISIIEVSLFQWWHIHRPGEVS